MEAQTKPPTQRMDLQPWLCVLLNGKKQKARPKGKPRGTLESESRNAISLLGERPPRYTGVGMS